MHIALKLNRRKCNSFYFRKISSNCHSCRHLQDSLGANKSTLTPLMRSASSLQQTGAGAAMTNSELVITSLLLIKLKENLTHMVLSCIYLELLAVFPNSETSSASLSHLSTLGEAVLCSSCCRTNYSTLPTTDCIPDSGMLLCCVAVTYSCCCIKVDHSFGVPLFSLHFLITTHITHRAVKTNEGFRLACGPKNEKFPCTEYTPREKKKSDLGL